MQTAIIFVIVNLSPAAEGKNAANTNVNNDDDELKTVTIAVSSKSNAF